MKIEAGLCEQCGLARSDCVHEIEAKRPSEEKPKLKKPQVSSLCAICGGSYINPGVLKFHIKKAHGKFVFQSDICQEVYNSRDSLRRNRDEKHKEPHFQCSDCDLMFHSTNQSWSHSNKKHKIDK